MDFSSYQLSPWTYLLPSSHQFTPENHFLWRQTPESHIFSADLQGVRKEEIKVEVEDSRYMVIRTEVVDGAPSPAKIFRWKFRLPVNVDIDGISAGYEAGVLTVTVTVPRRRGFFIDPGDCLGGFMFLPGLLETFSY